MKSSHILIASLLALWTVSNSAAEKGRTLGWDELGQLPPQTPIWVTTDRETACIFEKADEDQLFCRTIQSDLDDARAKDEELTFDRDQVRSVQIVPRRQRKELDDSRGSFDLMFAANGSFAPGPGNQPDIAAGGRIGRIISLDLNYDCIQGHSGFSVQNTAILPVLRYPQFKPGVRQKFVKLFIEPGVGYRFGQGPFGPYTSARALPLLTSHWTYGTPYVEFQHRFPFGNPWEGDNRVTVGYMMAIPQGRGGEN